ncbi:MAG: COG2426 family protein [Acutalibacteraceae bacterium]|nr:small multi-drug export protein [Oscillospiraceae bacterium]
MSEQIANYFVETLGGKVPEEIIVFIISMLPVLELRGGLIAAKLMELPFRKAFLICYAGNMLPIPFILKFIRYIFNALKKNRHIEKLITKLEIRSIRKGEKVKKYREWGLLFFVAVPLPGTGGWTGALIADLLDIRMKKSLPIIALGVLIAGIIMSALSYGLFGLIGC